MSHAPLNAIPQTASSGSRAMLLMKQARAAGEEQVAEFLQTLDLAVRQAREVAEGGEVYPAGVRDLCDKLAEHTAFRARTIEGIMRPARERDRVKDDILGVDAASDGPGHPAPAARAG
jgi:hypothetical protein